MPVNQQQIAYLNAMGIPVWISRDLPLPDTLSGASEVAHFNLDAALQSSGNHAAANPADKAKPALPASDKKSMQAASELIEGLQATPASKIADIAAMLDDSPVAQSPGPVVLRADVDQLDWAALQESVTRCTACDLHTKRQQTVFGRGNTQAQWLFVGDIPRLQDEWQQQPFTGAPGELLGAMLASLGLNAGQVYLTNLVKCRPPMDRAPEPPQAASCLSYLQRQIALLQPQVIVLMGRDTAQQVLGSSEPMAKLRQQRHQREGVTAPMIATYHPAYLLRQPRLKAMVWQDLQFAQKAMQ